MPRRIPASGAPELALSLRYRTTAGRHATRVGGRRGRATARQVESLRKLDLINTIQLVASRCPRRRLAETARCMNQLGTQTPPKISRDCRARGEGTHRRTIRSDAASGRPSDFLVRDLAERSHIALPGHAHLHEHPAPTKLLQQTVHLGPACPDNTAEVGLGKPQ
jgi:hypothetical protein